MIGRGAAWQFKDRMPPWFIIIFGLLALDSALHIGLLSTVSTWASTSRDALHPYGLPFRDGRMYFVQPWVGRYLDTWWIGIALLAVLVILLVVNRHQIERVL